jgi:7-cyano-7-deazaguanine reductase
MTSPPDKRIRYPVDTPEIIRTDLLDIIDYQYRTKRDIDIVIHQPEFTSVCPMTGLPDFGKIVIRYRPDKQLVELKSLKYYLLQYRNVGIFYEHVVNRILDDLVTVIAPKRMEVVGEFTARGGITSTISVGYETESGTDDELAE